MKSRLALLSCVFFLLSCADMMMGGPAFPSGPGRVLQPIDECNFHVQYGQGLRWESLPVHLTIHENSVSPSAVSATLKVVDEWNQTWQRESGQAAGLFEVLGLIDYSSPFETLSDSNNSVSFVREGENQFYGQGSSGGKFLQSKQQGITQVRGRFSMAEADVFINDESYDFFFESQNHLAQNRAEESPSSSRALASLEESKSFLDILQTAFKKLFDFLIFWKKEPAREPSSKRKRIPGHLIDFESLIAHELGHVLGLGHNESRGSIMRKKLAAGVTRRGLREVELDSLLCGYGGKTP